MRALIFGIIGIALGATAACSIDGAADSYTFGPREWTHHTPRIEVVEEPSLSALRVAAARAGVRLPADRELMAFSVVRSATGVCEMHVVRPETDYAPEWIGHEFAHCVWGRWHA